ncbi:MAG: DUF937 domain-containing protein [Rubrivivax sp.]
MSPSLTDQLFDQLQGAPLRQISQQLGIGPAQAAGAVSAALPMLLGALGRNASSPQGAADLFGALQRDHTGAGDLGGLLGAVLGGGESRQTDGGGILGHILGGSQERAEVGLGQATGLSGGQSGQLLKILAPIVLGFLATQLFKGQGAGAASAADPSADVLGSLLGREQAHVQQQGGLGGGLLGAVLDQDGDGQLGLGDLLKVAGGLLGGRR